MRGYKLLVALGSTLTLLLCAPTVVQADAPPPVTHYDQPPTVGGGGPVLVEFHLVALERGHDYQAERPELATPAPAPRVVLLPGEPVVATAPARAAHAARAEVPQAPLANGHGPARPRKPTKLQRPPTPSPVPERYKWLP